MITDKTGLPVKGYNSGPLGGDQQIGAKIVGRKNRFCGILLGSIDSTAT